MVLADHHCLAHPPPLKFLPLPAQNLSMVLTAMSTQYFLQFQNCHKQKEHQPDGSSGGKSISIPTNEELMHSHLGASRKDLSSYRRDKGITMRVGGPPPSANIKDKFNIELTNETILCLVNRKRDVAFYNEINQIVSIRKVYRQFKNDKYDCSFVNTTAKPLYSIAVTDLMELADRIDEIDRDY